MRQYQFREFLAIIVFTVLEYYKLYCIFVFLNSVLNLFTDRIFLSLVFIFLWCLPAVS